MNVGPLLGTKNTLVYFVIINYSCSAVISNIAEPIVRDYEEVNYQEDQQAFGE